MPKKLDNLDDMHQFLERYKLQNRADRRPQTSEKTRKPPHNLLRQKEKKKRNQDKEGAGKEERFPHLGKSAHQWRDRTG